MAFGLFKKKKKENNQPATDDRYLSLRIRQVRPETKDTVSLVFDEGEQQLSYQAGQFITIIDSVGGKKIRRAYSLCSSPFVDDFPAVTVKRVEGGKMSNHINDNYREGNLIEVMEPMGQFTTDYNADQNRTVIMFAGGSGITPLYSLTKSMLHKENKSSVILIYANETPDDVIFSEGLKKLQEKYDDRFKCIHVLNNPPSDHEGFKGWLSNEMIREIMEQLDGDLSDTVEFFTCGPAPMMDIVVSGLTAIGYSEESIMLESFEAGKTSPKEIMDEDVSSSKESKPVKIILDGEEHQFSVHQGKTILEEGLDHEIDMPYSCQSGLCTACRGKLLSGEVKMDQHDGLSQEEMDEGYVLCCQAFPKTDDVSIEIG